jgi:hypothetical protein
MDGRRGVEVGTVVVNDREYGDKCFEISKFSQFLLKQISSNLLNMFI